MLRNILLLGVVMLIVTSASAEWQMDEFMIFVWGGPTDASGAASENDAPAELLRDANFNVVMCRADGLKICGEYGLKALVVSPTPALAARVKDDPAVWGYLIKDEPGDADEYPPLARQLREFRQADPNHPGYINLGGSYRGFHPTFIDVVKPDLLSYDYYQWSWGQDNHFSRLEEYRAAALAAGIPLLFYEHGNVSPPAKRKDDYHFYCADSMQRMRQTVFTALAYGVKGIQWFMGRHLWDGKKLRPQGRDVAAINGELRRLGPTLVTLHSLDVLHTPPLPEATRPIPNDYWVRVREEDWVLGVFTDPQTNSFLLLANRDHTRPNRAELTIRRPGVQVDKMDKATGRWLRIPTRDDHDRTVVDLAAAAGDGELLRLR